MRKITVLMLTVSLMFSFYLAYLQIQEEQFIQISALEDAFTTPFMIPNDEALTDVETFYPLLVDSAKETGVNVFRPARYYSPDEEAPVEVIKYVLLTQETNFDDYIHIGNGRLLTGEESETGLSFLSSKETGKVEQVGRIRYFDDKTTIKVKPLSQSFVHVPIHGYYFMEASEEAKEKFLQVLAQRLNDHLQGNEDAVTYTVADLQVPADEAKAERSYLALYDLSKLSALKAIVFVITLLLFMYTIFHTTKTIGISKLYGFSNLRIWWQNVVRLASIALVFAVSLALVFAFTLQAPWTFLIGAWSSVGRDFLLFLVGSSVCYGYIRWLKVSDMLKYRKDTTAIFILNTSLKVICSIALISLSLLALQDYFRLSHGKENAILQSKSKADTWQAVNDHYGPMTVSMGHVTARTGREDDLAMQEDGRRLYALYSVLNKHGALYIDASEYEEEMILLNRNSAGIRSINVNVNYLEAFPIENEHGERIVISENDREWLLLVPAQYREREQEIRNYYESEGRRDFYLVEDEDQSLEIIWTKENQSVFSINPDVFPDEDHMIVDPIIHVKTDQNHLFVYSGGMRGGGLFDPLKMKLIDNDKEKTLQAIAPALRELQLDKRIEVQSIREAVEQDLQKLIRDRNIVLVMLGVIIVVFCLLIGQNTLIFFTKHKKRLVVRRLFGTGILKTYRGYFLWLFLTWGAVIGGAVLLATVVEEAIDLPFLLTILGISLIELIASILALLIMENRNQLQVTKKGA
ncbi:DUF1430 domain-containing protein [Shouchella lonarensis]|uniref:Bacteriocin-associated integral membrane (Putative immunity) protein n=1 Tax=Shouchella lonarensis TaxID=1464122 RepID=A0A1G6HF25_9BACI|nr:DUF1430 domain-containing protein [Shouchella lonarensis]SDB92718.1 bacteriocin-associated integral membrane (putative immunity) protein [Shouchella lonarensis]